MQSSFSDMRPLARSALDRMLAKAIAARLLIAPFLGSLALTFAFFEPTRWRKLWLSMGVALMFTLAAVEWIRYRRFGRGVVHVPTNVVIMALGQLLLLTASGGVFSPALPAILLLTVVTALFGQRRTLVLLIGVVVPYVWLLAWVHAYGVPVPSLLPKIYGGAQVLERGPAPWVAAWLFSIMMVTAAKVAWSLQALFDELLHDAMRERDRSLKLHAEQSQTLSLLTSEIAHELKNPLASLKGLGALVAKDVEGRTAERVKVLRGEVDRMQGILEEFLTLSRPLLPLALAEADLPELVRDVARLHEATASERDVEILVDGKERAVLSCDVRKVRQVLINLLQNAIDASPRGARVHVHVLHTADGLAVHILDEGGGLSPELQERLFEPFLTTKEQGTGLGLVVARSLARQHGGDVWLRAREHGTGMMAVLKLPVEPGGVRS